jgi:hypothetical protein
VWKEKIGIERQGFFAVISSPFYGEVGKGSQRGQEREYPPAIAHLVYVA